MPDFPNPPAETRRPTVPRRMAISDRRLLGDGGATSWSAWIEALAGLGVDAVQVREKDLDDAVLLELVRGLVEQARGRLLVLVNGRADIATAAGADGVHLPSDGLPTATVRASYPDLLIGRSTHSVSEIEAAGPVDYVTFGPIAETPSKAQYGAPLGIEGLCEAIALAERPPILALGGVDARTIAEVLGTGVEGVAAIRALADPSEAAAFLAAGEVDPGASCEFETPGTTSVEDVASDDLPAEPAAATDPETDPSETAS